MLGYATPNDASAKATFLFDDIQRSSTLSDNHDERLNRDEVRIYPNPAKDILTIRSKFKSIKTITFFDILGNQVKTLHPNSLDVTMDVAHLTSGLYIAKISTLEGVSSIKLIIE
jgi:hypothetical protein